MANLSVNTDLAHKAREAGYLKLQGLPYLCQTEFHRG